MNRTVGAGLPALGPRRRQSAGKPAPTTICWVGRVRRACADVEFRGTRLMRAVTRHRH